MGNEPPPGNAGAATSLESPVDVEGGRRNALLHEALRRLSREVIDHETGRQLPLGKLAKSDSDALLAKVVPQDDVDAYERVLRATRERLAAAGIPTPVVTLRYRNVSVRATPRVGETDVPTLARSLIGMARSALGATKHTDVDIVSEATGVLRPGRLTLLLGPPSSGKSTFMRALSCQLPRGLTVRGELTFNGKDAIGTGRRGGVKGFVPQRVACYVQQHDVHYGELTVRETVDFSARCLGSAQEADLARELAAREAELGMTPDPALDAFTRARAFALRNNPSVELVLRLLGLDICAETLVGNSMLRGISGGQKKRLGTAEVLVGRSRVVMADEISTGLDSNTTYNISRMLRDDVHVSRSTYLIALLQPGPETYELYDDVLLVSNGMVVYHGPKDNVLDAFQQNGFSCPPRVGPGGFLQEVTIPGDQRRFWSLDEERPDGRTAAPGYRYVTARTFRDTFQKSEIFLAISRELDATMLDESADPEEWALRELGLTSTDPLPSCPTAPLALPTHMYGTSTWSAIRANFTRSQLLQLRTILFAYVRVAQLVFMAVMLATTFLNTPTESVDDGTAIMGAAFFSMMMMLIGGLSEMHLVIMRLSVFYKQRDSLAYTPWAFAAPSFVYRIPFSFVDSTLWSLISYFAIGMSVSVRFLMFWLIMFILSVWSVSMFQCLAAICQSDTVTNAVGSFFMLVFLLTGGFILNKRAIPDWWIAAYYSNPWSYITEAVAINEFTSSSWDIPNPSDPSNPDTLGVQVLGFWDYHTSYDRVWIGVGTVLISILINLAGFLLACTLRTPPHRAPVVSLDDLEEIAYSRTDGLGEIPIGMANEIENSARRLAVVEDGAGDSVPTEFAVPADGGGSEPSATSKSSTSKSRGVSGTGGSSFRGAVIKSIIDDTPGEGAVEYSFANDSGDDSSPTKGGGASLGHVSLAMVPTDGSMTARTVKRSGLSVARTSQSRIKGKGNSASSVLPFRPLNMTFKGIEYSVPVPPGMDITHADVPSEGPHAGALRLLYGINGTFRPSVLTALMGASGAGKTTLMDVLAGRKTGGTITGDIHINGHPKRQDTFNRTSGYVEQTDVHLSTATVLEALQFSAALRLPSTVEKETVSQFVQEVMGLVELGRLSGACIGTPGESGLSIQQRKRLTIAVELVANPSIIFLDEPTTGLDARAASVVMSTVRNVVNTGRTVVCTIHQPSLDIFEEFDELLLLKPGGRCIFFGAVGAESRDLIAYFQSVPGVAPIGPGINPADWMLEQTNPHAEAKLGVDFSAIFEDSELCLSTGESIDALHNPPPAMLQPDLELGDLSVTAPHVQLRLLLHRLVQMYWRSPDYNLPRYFVTLLVAFVIGSLAWRQGKNQNDVEGILNIAGLLYMSTLFVGITNCMIILPVAVDQRDVMYRERAAGMYDVWPYALAQGFVEWPYLIVQTVLFTCVAYFMIYFIMDAGKVFAFGLVFGLCLFFFTGFGLLILNCMPDLSIASLVASVFFGLLNLQSGFLQTMPNTGWWWRWLQYANPVFWVIYGLVVFQLGDLNDEMILDFNNNLVTVPQFLEDRFGYKYNMRGPIIGILIGFIIACRLGGILSLRYINYQKR